MSCVNCKSAVESAIKDVLGVEDVNISLDEGFAVVRGTADAMALVDAIEKAGFTAEVEK